MLTQVSPSVPLVRHQYAMYGLNVASDFRLPTEPRPRSSECADVEFRRVDWFPTPDDSAKLVAQLRCQGPCHMGNVYSRVYRGPGGAWMVNEGVAACRVTPTADRVDVYRDARGDDHQVGLFLAGELSTLLLQARGRPCLHASAVAIDGGAVAFLGPQGRGKSTMAANFLSHGASLLTDDLLSLRVGATHVHATPGLPMMKLWRKSVEHTLRLNDDLPNVVALMDKKLVSVQGRYAYATDAVPLKAIYLLERYDPVAVASTEVHTRLMTGHEVLATLLGQSSHPEFLLPHESAAVLRSYSQLARLVPVRALRFPDGFAHQETVYAHLLADLDQT